MSLLHKLTSFCAWCSHEQHCCFYCMYERGSLNVGMLKYVSYMKKLYQVLDLFDYNWSSYYYSYLSAGSRLQTAALRLLSCRSQLPANPSFIRNRWQIYEILHNNRYVNESNHWNLTCIKAVIVKYDSLGSNNLISQR